MIEQMENKLSDFIKSILEKDNLTYCDYQVLVDEIGRQKTKIKTEIWEAEQEQRNEAMISALKGIWNTPYK